LNHITGHRAVRTRPFWFLNTIHFTDCVCHSIILVHIVAYLTDTGFRPAIAARVLGVAGGAAAAGTIISGALIDKVGGRGALRAALICQVITVFLLPHTLNLWFIYILAVSFGLGLGGLVTPYPVLTREYFKEDTAGTIYGGQLTSATAGMALGGFLGGYLFDITGDYNLAFTVSLIAGLTALFFGFALRKPSHEIRPAPALYLE